MRQHFNNLFRQLAYVLAYIGIIDKDRGERIADIAWPRIATGITRHIQRAADLAMVGIALGPNAIAGMAFALTYWSFASGIGSALSNGAVTLISTSFGAGDYERMSSAIKIGFIVSVLVALPITTIYILFAPHLIQVLGAEPTSVVHGTTYLRVIAITLIFRFPNKIIDRTLVSVNDAYTPMVLRAGGAALNLVLNGILIFWLDMGVFGAALGTLLATLFVTVSLAFVIVSGRIILLGSIPISLDLARPGNSLQISRRLIVLSLPLMVRQIVGRGGVFILIAIVAQFGTAVVVAYEVARRVRKLLNTPSWGFSPAASSLVGQQLGGEAEREAEAYGRDILSFAMVFYTLGALFAVLFAHQIASVFVQTPTLISVTVPFIQVIAISIIGRGWDSVMTGILRAGGDTAWPLYGKLIGIYLITIPIASLASTTTLGVMGLYIAVNTETFAPAAITFYRFRTGKWKAVSRTAVRSTP